MNEPDIVENAELFPPFFPDTKATQHAVVLLRMATWLMAAYVPLHRIENLHYVAYITRAVWISCAAVGLCLMGKGIFNAITARGQFLKRRFTSMQNGG